MRDIPGLLRLINGFAAEGIMLPRTEFEIAENIRDFSVIHEGEHLAGCAALHFYTPLAGEIRSLAVERESQKRQAGRRLVEALVAEAKAFALQSVFAFTYIPAFFQKLGFTEIERGELPLKAWKDCLRCPKFQCCDEIAVIKPLEGPEMRVADTLICGILSPDDRTPANGGSGLPIIKPR
jgi:amino-acid N-acetyltransferase